MSRTLNVFLESNVQGKAEKTITKISGNRKMNPKLNISREALSIPDNRKADSKWKLTSPHNEQGQEWGQLYITT